MKKIVILKFLVNEDGLKALQDFLGENYIVLINPDGEKMIEVYEV